MSNSFCNNNNTNSILSNKKGKIESKGFVCFYSDNPLVKENICTEYKFIKDPNYSPITWNTIPFKKDNNKLINLSNTIPKFKKINQYNSRFVLGSQV